MDGQGVFISHRRSDANWAGIMLESHITSRFGGVRVFFDLKSLKAGEVWPEGIEDNLGRSSALIAVIGRTWLTVTDKFDRRRIDDEDDWVRREIGTALKRGIPVIPVLLDEARMPGSDDPRALPKDLRELPNRQALQLRMADYVQDLDRLADELAHYLPPDARRPAQRDVATEPADTTPGAFVSIPDTAALIARASADTDTLRAIMIEEQNKGNSKLAEALAHHVGEREKQESDVDHRLTLVSRAIEAQAILRQGRAKEAEAALRTLIPEMEAGFGADDPNTLATRHEHAHAIHSQGRAAEAEALLRDLLLLEEKVKGAEHPDTLTTRHNLANAILDQGRAAEAEALFRDLLPLSKKVLGAKHPDTLGSRRSLALAALEQGAVDRARAALAPLPLDGGDPDPLRKGQTALLRAWIADLEGRTGEAEALLDQAEGHLAHLAPEHYARRELAKYRATRGPDGKGGTTLWMRDP